MHMSHYRSDTRTINMSRCRMSHITRIQSQLVNQRNVSRELSNRAANILEAVITIWIWFYGSGFMNAMKKEVQILKKMK